MAYNPGVTDISGQIRAQSIVGGAQSIGSSVENAFKEYRQNETKRKLASAAVNGAFQADPAVMQALSSDPEAAKLLQKRQSGKATVSDEMYLAGMVGAYGKAKEEKQAMEMRGLQMQQAQASMAHLAKQNEVLQQQMAESKAAEERRATNARAIGRAFEPVGLAGQIAEGKSFEQLSDAGPADPVKNYARSGGADPAMLAQLANYQTDQAKLNAPRLAPGIMNMGKDAYGRDVQYAVGPDGKARLITQPGGMEFEMTKDGTVRLSQGKNGLTTPNTTQAQANQFQYERIFAEGEGLIGKLRDSDLGVRGNINEQLTNAGIGQYMPGAVDKQVSENRTQLRLWREGLLRSISGDPRFNKDDRAALEKIVPGDGWMESLPAAQAKIRTIQGVIQERAGIEAGRLGKTSVLYQTPENIVQQAKEGRIPPEMAAQLLSSLHPEWVAEQKKKQNK